MKVNKIGFLLGLFFSIIYVLLSYYWSYTVVITGDTLEYYYTFLNIANYPFPWFLEYFTSTLMWIVNFLGMDFNGFLFFSNLLWLPLVYIIFYKSEKDIFFLLIGMFFLSYLFFTNASFLVRQYHSFLFFLMFFFSEKKSYKFLFLLLSIFSHLSAILFFILSEKKVSKFILRNKIIILFLFIPMCFIDFLFYFDLVSNYIINNFGFVSFERKVVGANEYIENMNPVIQTSFVILNLIIIAIISFSKKFDGEMVMSGLFSLIFISSMIYVIMRNEPIMANRIGFVAFSFIIPSLILVLRNFYVKFK